MIKQRSGGAQRRRHENSGQSPELFYAQAYHEWRQRHPRSAIFSGSDAETAEQKLERHRAAPFLKEYRRGRAALARDAERARRANQEARSGAEFARTYNAWRGDWVRRVAARWHERVPHQWRLAANAALVLSLPLLVALALFLSGALRHFGYVPRSLDEAADSPERRKLNTTMARERHELADRLVRERAYPPPVHSSPPPAPVR